MAPSFLRKRLQCFYCGHYSSGSIKAPVRQWKCADCQAENYLDENGEIMDPPVAEASASENTRTQYAVPLPNAEAAASSSFAGSERGLSSQESSTLFCSTCLKNQQILTQALASYFPPSSDPDYAAFDASYPAYRKSLEERYPQVCESCEPRIRERIRQAGYVAKADHLRRLMERSRSARLGGRRTHTSFKWRSFLVSAGAVAFWLSVAGQLSWNVMGAVSAENNNYNGDILSAGTDMEVEVDSLLSTSSLPSLPLSRVWLCVFQAMKHSRMPSECATVLQPYNGLALTLGVLSVWWNPKLRYKVDGCAGRLKGLREYYQIQIVVLVMRFAAWAFLQDDLMITELNPKLPAVVHILVGVFTVISVIASRAAIKFDTTPLVKWQDTVEPLIQKPQSKTQTHLISPPNSQSSTVTSNLGSSFERFPISNLAVAERTSSEPLARLTPPYETAAGGDDDAMDWAPSQQDFKPIINTAPLLRRSPSPPVSSIFHGQLPPVPKPPSWQLRNRNAVSAVKPVESRPNPFHGGAPVLRPTLSSALDETQDPPLPSKGGEMVMAPPRFFPPSDLAADTGLESLFDKTFSLADAPNEVRSKQRPWNKNVSQSLAMSNHRTSHVLKCVLLTISLITLGATQVSSLPRNTVETVVLAACFLIAGFSLLESLIRPMVHWSVVDFLLPILELGGCVYLSVLRTRGVYDEVLFDRAGKGLAAFMLVQEVMALRSMIISTAAPSSFPSQLQPAAKPAKPAKPQQQQQARVLESQHIPSPQQTLRPSNPTRSLAPKREPQFGMSTIGNSFSSNASTANYPQPAIKPTAQPLTASFSTQNSAAYSASASQSQSQPQPFQNQHNTRNHNPTPNLSQSTPYPPPFSSFSRPPVDSSLSFSSFGSAALPKHAFSTASTVSTAADGDDDNASSDASTNESPSPRRPRNQYYTPYSAKGRRRSIRSPSIAGLTLDDSPIRPKQAPVQQPQPRYSLRNRRG